MIKKATSALLDFIFPRRCHICDTPLPSSRNHLCTVCETRLPRTMYHTHPLNPVEKRFAGRFPFQRATAYFFYTHDSDIASLIHDFKYRQFKGLAKELGTLIAKELLITGFFSDIDLLVPIPMHWTKKARRGYNQTQEIARGISRITGLPIDTTFRAKKAHQTQTRKTAQQRLQNTQGIFHLPIHSPSSFPAWLPSRFPAWLPSRFPAWLPSRFPAWFPACLPSRFPTWFPAWLPSMFPAWFPTWFPAWFCVSPLGRKSPNPLENRHILLIDDVCTTGSTLISAATTILAASPSTRISILTLAATT